VDMVLWAIDWKSAAGGGRCRRKRTGCKSTNWGGEG
jgi:hypothetical protein